MSNSSDMRMKFKTSELNFFQKLMQGYWANPKSWLLDEFSLEDGKLTVVRKNGDRFEAELSEITAKYSVDQYDRREITIVGSESGKKTRFKEIPGMLDDNEWETIIAALNPKKSGIGKLNDVLRTIKDKLEG